MGYLLDTNVLSELRKGRAADPSVRAWHEESKRQVSHISVLTLGEIRNGIERIRPRDVFSADALEKWLHNLEVIYADHILPVTKEISDLWGRLSAPKKLPPIDGLLAATALHHSLTLVTRNTADIARCGVSCINPFKA